MGTRWCSGAEPTADVFAGLLGSREPDARAERRAAACHGLARRSLVAAGPHTLQHLVLLLGFLVPLGQSDAIVFIALFVSGFCTRLTTLKILGIHDML